jgi:hypothetical protein
MGMDFVLQQRWVYLGCGFENGGNFYSIHLWSFIVIGTLMISMFGFLLAHFARC